jgi:hypothetical protein
MVTPGAAFNSTAFKLAKQAMYNRRRPIGKALMTKALYEEAIDLPASSVGFDIASGHYRNGVENEEKLWGLPVVTTIKSHVLNPRAAYIFSPHDYLGNFFLLQDATLFIEQKADIIHFYAYAAPGIGIANRLSLQRIGFPGSGL